MKGTIAVEFEPLSLEPLNILDLLINFGFPFLDLAEIELLQVGSFSHFKYFLNYTQQQIKYNFIQFNLQLIWKFKPMSALNFFQLFGIFGLSNLIFAIISIMSYDYLVSPIRVTVPSFKENKADSSAVYFNVELEINQNKWYVEKRFSEFDNLYKSLKNTYHNVPILPNKSFIFKISENELDQRRKGLEEFLQKMVIRNDLMNSEAVKSFLQLDKNASEMMVNPPKLALQYVIDGQSKGVRDFIYNEEQKVFYIVTADMNPMSRLNAKVSNAKLPWQNETGKSFMEVGSIEAWAYGEDSSKFIKMWSKGYPKQAITLSYDKASNRILVGLDDGVIDVIQVTNNGYEDVACVKAHQGRVTGVVYDAMSNVIYSVSQDKVLRVSHGSSISLIVGVPHKEPIFSMLRDTLNKRLLFGTKTGQIYIYDISQAQKPKVLTVLQNNKKGSIRCLNLDINRNYLFTGSYDDGELNVFDLDKPGREKYAKMIATLKGKQKVRAICWGPKRSEIFAGNEDGTVTFWNAVQGKSIYVLQAFDNDITSLHYVEQRDTLIVSSKGKSIKLWTLPREWRDAKLVADEEKKANTRAFEAIKSKVVDALRKGEEDSDNDDLAGWHLD